MADLNENRGNTGNPDMLHHYAQDGDAFAVWVGHHPTLALQVNRDLQTAHLVLAPGSAHLSAADCLAARDALARLMTVAAEGRFVDTVQVFYYFYETCCRILLAATTL